MRTLIGWLRVALIDMRGDLGRFGVLLACLALGVGTIAIVGSVGASLQAALARDARTVLGADLEAQLSYREALPAERAMFESLGTVSEVIEVMGRGRAAGGTAFMSLRAVDANYPLLGAVEIEAGDDAGLATMLAPGSGLHGVVVDHLLLDRLGVAVGSELLIGTGTFEIRGVLGSTPDQATLGVQVGIPALISIAGLAETGILAPGVLARYRYKIVLDEPDFDVAAAAISSNFSDAGWQIRSPRDATSDLARFFDQFSRFLIIVGLSALLVGGVGVSNAVAAYITERQRSIATMRSLGATQARILVHFLVQVAILTLLGVLLGLGLGAAMTLLVLPVIGPMLGIALPPLVDPPSLVTAAAFGLLIGFAFAYLPLRRALTMRPALLFRTAGSAVEGGLGWRDLARPGLWLPLLGAIAGIIALAAVTTGRPVLVLWYAAGVVAAFAILRASAWLLQHLLRLVPPPSHAGMRNAIKSIYRSGAPAPTVILSLGLGLALLLLIATIDNNLRNQLDGGAMADAPSFVFMDLFDDEAAALDAFAQADPRIEGFSAAPMLRGAITSIGGVPAGELQPPSQDAARILVGEIPLTWSGPLPARSEMVAGQWWPADYAGEPLVSVFTELREPLGLELGDIIAFQIFGDMVEARIANFRDFPWRGGAVNFSFVLSPGEIERFPATQIGLLKAAAGADRAVQSSLVEAFPELIFLPVGEALMAVAAILDSVTNAVAIIGGLSLVSGLFVLAGAMAAGRRQREADAVVMKVLGASRGDVIRAYLVEYGLLGGLSALLAVLLGLAGAWAFITQVLQLTFTFDAGLIALVVLGAVALTIAIGTLTTWSALSLRPATYLRAD